MSSDIPLEDLNEIDGLCDAFELQLQDHQSPSIEDILKRYRGNCQEFLFFKLFELEIAYIQLRGQTIDEHRYIERFPDYASGITSYIKSTCGVQDDFATEVHDKAPSKKQTLQFLPGDVLASRYRIVALLGRGGMGEVYRADDLRLGHSVALKFLPTSQETDQRRLAFFYDEVRLSQKLSHPHICRVNDLVEADNLRFLSMEFIDGENLQELLRRIGRVPESKGIELAQQICQGLAAAHDAGVLHRDLKPANIMIDERGRARITDFGLACETHDTQQSSSLVGSPPYMAPEQLAHNRTSPQSDIYSLGLVLFELFTGRRVHNPDSLESLKRQHESGLAESLASEATELSPESKDVIARCVATKYQNRPQTVQDVAALLPGGSPLSAILAAGNTPSPEIVAEAGSHAVLPKRQRLALAGSIAALLLVACVLSVIAFDRLGLFRDVALQEETAKQIIQDAGLPLRSSATYGHAVLKTAASVDQRDQREEIAFWYRQSDVPLAPLVPDWTGDSFLSVDLSRPPMVHPGDLLLRLDEAGRLKYLTSLPSHREHPSEASPEWDKLLEHAGVTENEATIQEAASDFVPPLYVQQKKSWQPSSSKASEPAGTVDPWTQIDAAATEGQIVYFRKWSSDLRAARDLTWSGLTGGNPIAALIFLFWIPALTIACAVLAKRNLSSKRADRAGAQRLAGFCAAIALVVWVGTGSHVAHPLEIDLFFTALAGTILLSAIVWAAYIAFEPLVRRHWPRTLIGWSRVLQGQYKDPLVAKEILLGINAGLAAACLKLVMVQVPYWLGYPSVGLGNIYNLSPLTGLRSAAGELFLAIALAVLYSIFFQLLFLIGLKLLLRKTSAAGIAFVVFLSSLVAVQYEPMAFAFLITAIEMTMTVAVYLRSGLLTAVVMHFVRLMMKWPPLDSSQWYGETGAMAVAAILGLTAWSLYHARPRSPSSPNAFGVPTTVGPEPAAK